MYAAEPGDVFGKGEVEHDHGDGSAGAVDDDEGQDAELRYMAVLFLRSLAYSVMVVSIVINSVV